MFLLLSPPLSVITNQLGSLYEINFLEGKDYLSSDVNLAEIVHIGFLQAYFSRSCVGGGELHTERLARALEDRGHEVTVFTDKPDEHRSGIEDLQVREYPTPLKLNPVNELTLAQRAFSDLQECDVVTLTDDSAWRGVDLPVPTAMIFHIVWHGWVKRHRPLRQVYREKPQALLYKQMERKICRRSDAIVSISPNIREDILLVGDFADKIIDISNGVDTDRFSPVAGTSDDNFTVYFQGRLVKMKNPHLLVEAAAHSDEGWRLVVGGDGPVRDKLEQLVNEYGLANRVKFLGYVKDVRLPDQYAGADLFTLPSDYEGMPLTVLEAASSGTAILTSPRAATDFVTDEIGVVVDPDAETIARTIDTLSRSPRQVTQMSKAARARAEQYSWSVIAKKYEALYEKLIS